MKLENISKAAKYADQLEKIEHMIDQLRDFDEDNPPKSRYATGDEPALQLSSVYFDGTAALSKSEGLGLLSTRAKSLRMALKDMGVVVE